jgi:hypothetical protein
MRAIRNLEGTFMRVNTPLFHFRYERGCLVDYESLCKDIKIMPIDIRWGGLTPETIAEVLDDRVVPETRQGLEYEMKEAGIPYFSMENLIRYNSGISVCDTFWVRLPDGPQTFEEAFKAMGFSEGYLEYRLRNLVNPIKGK